MFESIETQNSMRLKCSTYNQQYANGQPIDDGMIAELIRRV